jgi:hypothetical protein
LPLKKKNLFISIFFYPSVRSDLSSQSQSSSLTL